MEKADIIKALEKFGEAEKDIKQKKEEISTIELQQKNEETETRIAKLQCQISELETFRNCVQNEIDRLPYSQREVIIRRFVWRWKWIKIARYIHYCKRNAEYILGKALDSLAENPAIEKALKGVAFFGGDNS